ncbi:hypothetical protein GCM10022289_44800 [Pedobacter jeongneungensis]|uniref:DUF4276 family protein n=1 Tax=Pedobacter jeongneungensis TaxID=947309 RepID=A0ABP8BQV9_9SPHI
MINVGLVGEDPNDTVAISKLLSKKYAEKIRFHSLAKRLRGCQLDSPKILKTLPIDFKDKECEFIIYVRDLDGFSSEKAKFEAKNKWFTTLDARINGQGILLLNIWELECLILGDIETFNRLYNVNCNFKGDPVMIKDPKGFLMKETAKSKKKYQESHCRDIFGDLDFEKVSKNCSPFRTFIKNLDEKLSKERS